MCVTADLVTLSFAHIMTVSQSVTPSHSVDLSVSQSILDAQVPVEMTTTVEILRSLPIS